MKTITLKVELEFDANIDDDNEIKEVMVNVLNGITSQVNIFGIAPENSEAITTKIDIYEVYTGEKISMNM